MNLTQIATIYTTVGKNSLEEIGCHSQQKSPKCSIWLQSKKMTEWSVCLQGKPFNITVIQVYAPTSNAEEAEVEWFYEDLEDLLEIRPKKDVLFIIGDWNAKVGSQETPGEAGKFGLGMQNEAKQRLIESCKGMPWS